MTTCIAGKAAGAWVDLGSCVGSAPTLQSVGWSCASTCPPSGTGPTASSILGSSGPSGIIGTWAGGSYDSDDNVFLATGGGHQAYFGNEIYAFSFATLTWSRLDVPSASCILSGSEEVCPDGQPVANHTYQGGNLYAPGFGMYDYIQCGQANGGCNPSYSFRIQHPLSLDPNNFGGWVALTHTINGLSGDGIYEGVTIAYSPAQQKFYLGMPGYFVYSSAPPDGAFTLLPNSNPFQVPGINVTSDIDDVDNLLVSAGNEGRFVVDINSAHTSTYGAMLTCITSPPGGSTCSQGAESGATSCAHSTNAPGFAWRKSTHNFICWNGGSNTYVLDVSTPTNMAWTAHTSNTGSPPSATPQANGTFRRAFWVDKYGVFVIVNAWDQHVFAWIPDF